MTRFGYPKVPGDGPWSVVDLTGPASYAVVAGGANPTGGQLVTAAECGLQSFDWLQGSGSNTGVYEVIVFPVPFSPGNVFSSARLMWITAATGAQVTAGTNLSTFTVRLLAIGH
jgi:hypothetical protein